jgi:hypothetical protein
LSYEEAGVTEAEAAEPGGTDTGGDAGRAPRGAGYPALDLEKAVGIIHTVGAHGGDLSVSAFAQYCGHSTANSGPFRTKVAAFRDWSLATKKGDRILLTDLGKEVAKSPDPMADHGLLRQVFEACKIFQAFVENQAKGVPIKRETLGRAAVFDHKISAKTQDQFVATLVDSLTTVGLATTDGEAGTVTFLSAADPAASAAPTAEQAPGTDPAAAATAAPAAQPPAAPPAHAPAAQAPATPSAGAPVLLRQVWPTASGEVVLAIHSTDPLPASAFTLVGDVVQAAEALANSIGLSAEPAKPVGLTAAEDPEGDDAA